MRRRDRLLGVRHACGCWVADSAAAPDPPTGPPPHPLLLRCLVHGRTYRHNRAPPFRPCESAAESPSSRVKAIPAEVLHTVFGNCAGSRERSLIVSTTQPARLPGAENRRVTPRERRPEYPDSRMLFRRPPPILTGGTLQQLQTCDITIWALAGSLWGLEALLRVSFVVSAKIHSARPVGAWKSRGAAVAGERHDDAGPDRLCGTTRRKTGSGNSERVTGRLGRHRSSVQGRSATACRALRAFRRAEARGKKEISPPKWRIPQQALERRTVGTRYHTSARFTETAGCVQTY
ncbi:MAG: hypothetical protein BJ554DRAFT_7917 [Olpidium bornovanus]|uniref:Uncharacterized protein n=1 Tax=Olpidium bornovanus TaxID=278681 RepID=A0A8H7ZVD7_9FUNG|nr:MAG: hypothetical protein BJ554DRAFT_7917 [Olpidium bornovanus]